MSYSTIQFEITGRIARLTLNRPEKLNAFNEVMLEEMVTALGQVARNPDLNVLVLAGNGRGFCSGVDTSGAFFLQPGQGEDSNGGAAFTNSLYDQHRMIKALAGLPQVTIAAVHGVCVGGGGFGMAMACDMRVAADSARFWMIPVKVAVIQDYGIPWHLARQIGTAKTLEILLTGDRVSGEEAAALGFVNRCVPEAELMDATNELAEKIAAGAPLSTKMAKASVYRGMSLSLAEQLDTEAVGNGLTTTMDDAREGFEAYAAKRAPNFRGR
jgi:enoyl-CoA hydratase/carnithine racemase